MGEITVTIKGSTQMQADSHSIVINVLPEVRKIELFLLSKY